MKTMIVKISLIVLLSVICSFSGGSLMGTKTYYYVGRLKKAMKIDANWDKPQWKNVQSVEIRNFMGTVPAFKPEAQVKMLYDNDYIYVIFHVKDRFVRCITSKINGPVWQDSAVEFFFAPDPEIPLQYFNLETNCGGTPLMHYNLVPRKQSMSLSEEDIKRIEIASTLPSIIDPEIKEEVNWTLEYRIPLDLLEKYSKVERPKQGVEWRANFYKIAENSTNPHYITWAEVENEKPDFHKPQFFGRLIFE